MEKNSENILLGNYLNCYSGHARDKNIRYNASSGGVITALLIYALKEKIIDGALVLRMVKDSPLQAESFIARTEEEIISAKGSKYCPVSLENGLKEIIGSKNGKYAVVGLCCHIKAIKKMESYDAGLKEKIVLHLGLFCNRMPNSDAIEFLFKKHKVKKGDVAEVNYRGLGWPGSMAILKKNGEKILIPLNEYWNILGSDFFALKSCLVCSDHTAELSDLSFGDAWLPEFAGDKAGTSIIISRTRLGEKLLQEAAKDAIEIKSLSSEKVADSQIIQLYVKKKAVKARAKLLGEKITYENVLNPDILDYLISFLIIINTKLPPFRLFAPYNKVIKWLCYKKAKIKIM